VRFRLKSDCKPYNAQPFFANAFFPPFQSSLSSIGIYAYFFDVLHSLRLMDFRCFTSLDLDVPISHADKVARECEL
jgi:hypothetical protein